MTTEEELVLLQERPDLVGLAQLRSLLDGHDIRYVVQGEHHSSMLGQANPIVTPRVLVASGDLERAHALLAAAPQAEGPAPTGIEGAVCPVHEHDAVATCDRCGTFLCKACNALGNPPLCEDCVEQESKTLRPGPTSMPAQAMLGFPLALILLAALLMWLFGRG